MPKLKYKEAAFMFSDELLEKIFSDEEVQKIPIGCQHTMVKAIEKILDEMGVDIDESISKSKLL